MRWVGMTQNVEEDIGLMIATDQQVWCQAKRIKTGWLHKFRQRLTSRPEHIEVYLETQIQAISVILNEGLFLRSNFNGAVTSFSFYK
jgi:hypothetical protein